MLLSCMKPWCRRAPLLPSLFNRHPLPSSVLLGLPKKMTLSGGGFPQPYQADQLHLHWGSGQTRPGSEHTVDGHRYAGEVNPSLLSTAPANRPGCLAWHLLPFLGLERLKCFAGLEAKPRYRAADEESRVFLIKLFEQGRKKKGTLCRMQ